MRPVILYRKIDEFDEYRYGNELEFAEKYFYCTSSRLDLKEGDLVIARYSYLPYAQELEKDILKIGAKPINTYRQHRYIADLKNWYEDLEGQTPKTWFQLSDVPITETGPFFLKGETNSKKFCWDSHAYAKDREAATNVFLNLLDDGLISEQQIYVRKFEKLVRYDTAPRGLPITKEFRIFVAYGEILTMGYYWSSHEDELKEKKLFPDTNEIPFDWLNKCISQVAPNATAFAIDVAQKEDGSWIVIELNDLTMSGLSCNDTDTFYKNLYAAVIKNNA